MNLVTFLLADYANMTADNKLNVMGVFNNVFASSFPARHPMMYLVAKLSPEIGELDQEKHLTLKFEDSDKHEIWSAPITLTIAQDARGERPDCGLILQLTDFVLPREGDFEFVAYMDNEQLGSVPVRLNIPLS